MEYLVAVDSLAVLLPDIVIVIAISFRVIVVLYPSFKYWIEKITKTKLDSHVV